MKKEAIDFNNPFCCSKCGKIDEAEIFRGGFGEPLAGKNKLRTCPHCSEKVKKEEQLNANEFLNNKIDEGFITNELSNLVKDDMVLLSNNKELKPNELENILETVLQTYSGKILEDNLEKEIKEYLFMSRLEDPLMKILAQGCIVSKLGIFDPNILKKYL